MRKSDVQIEQMEALIATIPVPERQNKLRYDFIYKIPFVENLRHTVAFRLMNILSNNKEFEPHFKYTIFDDIELNGSYDSVTNNGNITVNESEERFIITYKGEELVINITPDLKTGEAHLVINGTTFNKIEPLEIREHIIPIIDDTFKDWGLLSEETVQ